MLGFTHRRCDNQTLLGLSLYIASLKRTDLITESKIGLNLRILSFVWLELTKVSQAAAARNLWIDPSKYPRKYPKYQVRQWAFEFL